MGIANLFLHLLYHPKEKMPVVSAVIISVFLLVKSFSVLRVFENLSRMVTMLSQVTKDISSFVLFFMIIIWQCSLILNAIGLTDVAANEKRSA